MKTYRCLLFLTLVATSGCAPLFPSPGTRGTCAVASLQPGESLEMRYSEQGCMGGASYELVFTPDGSGFAVNGFRLPHSLKKNGRDPKFPLRKVRLSRHEATKIDRLLEFYRQEKQRLAKGDLNSISFSTTTETFEMNTMKGSLRLASENFRDSSGTAHRHTDVLTISGLIERMR